VYDRARAALANQLQKVDPPFAFEHERLALEDAISKVEADTISGEGTRPTPEGSQVESNEPGSLAKNIERSRGQGQDVTEVGAGEVDTLARWFLALCFG
jgi:hypothetical protein